MLLVFSVPKSMALEFLAMVRRAKATHYVDDAEAKRMVGAKIVLTGMQALKREK